MKQFINRQTAAEEFQVSVKTVTNIWNEIRDRWVGRPPKRYRDTTFRGEGKTLQIRYAVMDDYMRNREWLNDLDTVNLVPDFDLRQAERELGVIGNESQVIKINPKEIAHEIMSEMGRALNGN